MSDLRVLEPGPAPPVPIQAPVTPVSAPVQTAPQAPVKGGDFWSNLGAGGYEGLNQFAFGLPDMVAGLTGTENYKKLQDWKAANPVGTTLGGTAGNIASMFIPGFGAAKALGTGAKLGDLALQGAKMSASQAIPRAVTGAVTDIAGEGKDAGQAIKDRANEAILGTALGAGINPALGKASEFLKGLGKGFTRQMGNSLNLGIGVTDKDIVSKLEELAPSASGTDAFVQSNLKPFQEGLARYAKDQGINSAKDVEAYLVRQKPIMDKVSATWDANPPPMMNVWQKVLSDPGVDHLIQSGKVTPAQISQIGQSTVVNGRMGKYFDLVGDRGVLNNAIHDTQTVMRNAQDANAIQEARNTLTVLSAMKRSIQDEAFSKMPEAQDLRANWKYRDVLVNAAKNNSGMESASNTMGEGSFARFGNAALGAGALGAGLGLVTPGDQQSNSMLGGLMGVGTSILAPRLIPSIVKAAQARIGSALLPKAGTGTSRASQAINQILGKTPAAAGIAPSILPQTPVTPATPPQSMSIPVGIHASQAPVSMGGDSMILPGPVKTQMQSPFGQKLLDSLNMMYNQYQPTINGKPATKQEFLNEAYKYSDGFNANNPATINMLTSDPAERQMLQSSIPKLESLKDPGRIDLNKLVSIQSNVAGNVGADPAAKRSNDAFVQLLAELNNKDPAKQPSASDRTSAQAMLDRIRGDYSMNDAEKKRQIMNLLAQNGFPIAKLQALGLTHGTQLEGLQ